MNEEQNNSQEVAKNKKPVYKKWWFWVGGVIVFFLFLGAFSEPEQVTDRKQDVVSTQEEKIADVYPAGQEAKAGKSIWKVLGILKEGKVIQLPQGFELGKVSYEEPTGGQLLGVILDFVNFSDISLFDFKEGETKAVLLDDKDNEHNSLSYERVISIFSAKEEEKIGSYVKHLLKNPWDSPFVYIFIIPDSVQELKIKVRDETKYSNQETLISLDLPNSKER